MTLRVVQLGRPRARGEGLRIGTVRRPPRGVPKQLYAAQDWYDVWLPTLAPSAELMGWIHAQDLTAANWRRFEARYRREMSRPDATHLIALLAALSRQTNLAVGCYCDDETRCHRSLLRELLRDAGAQFAVG